MIFLELFLKLEKDINRREWSLRSNAECRMQNAETEQSGVRRKPIENVDICGSIVGYIKSILEF